jgi:hypothetical protein
MYGLPQAGIIANERLVKHLAPFGYCEELHTPGLFLDNKWPIPVCLIVNNFGIKYVGRTASP